MVESYCLGVVVGADLAVGRGWCEGFFGHCCGVCLGVVVLVLVYWMSGRLGVCMGWENLFFS